MPLLPTNIDFFDPSGKVTSTVEPLAALPETTNKPDFDERELLSDGAVTLTSGLPPPPLPPHAASVVAKTRTEIDLEKLIGYSPLLILYELNFIICFILVLSKLNKFM